MAQNHGFRAGPWANVPLPNGPWAPLAAVAAVLATVALVVHGPRIGGDSPAVPDGRPHATADSTPGDALDRIDPEDDPTPEDLEPAPTARSTPRIRRRAPAASHRRRRSTPARRAAPPRGRRPVPAPRAAPQPAPIPATPGTTSAVRRPATPHRAPLSSAEREFGP